MLRAVLALTLMLVSAPAWADDDFTLKLSAADINYLTRVLQTTPLVYNDWAPIAQKIQDQTQAQIRARQAPPTNSAVPLPITPPPPKR